MNLTACTALAIIAFCSCNYQSGSYDSRVENQRIYQVTEMAETYFQTFSERKDWDKLCSFYRDDLSFEDVLLQIRLDSLWQFKRFYNWPDTNFRKLTPDQDHLTITSLAVNDSVAVATGHLNPFYWYNELKDTEWGMSFTIWLWFDDSLKIYQQRDWMEYEPEVFESVINRFRNEGIEKPPSWLDLSR